MLDCAPSSQCTVLQEANYFKICSIQHPTPAGELFNRIHWKVLNLCKIQFIYCSSAAQFNITNHNITLSMSIRSSSLPNIRLTGLNVQPWQASRAGLFSHWHLQPSHINILFLPINKNQSHFKESQFLLTEQWSFCLKLRPHASHLHLHLDDVRPVRPVTYWLCYHHRGGQRGQRGQQDW